MNFTFLNKAHQLTGEFGHPCPDLASVTPFERNFGVSLARDLRGLASRFITLRIGGGKFPLRCTT